MTFYRGYVSGCTQLFNCRSTSSLTLFKGLFNVRAILLRSSYSGFLAMILPFRVDVFTLISNSCPPTIILIVCRQRLATNLGISRILTPRVPVSSNKDFHQIRIIKLVGDDMQDLYWPVLFSGCRGDIYVNGPACRNFSPVYPTVSPGASSRFVSSVIIRSWMASKFVPSTSLITGGLPIMLWSLSHYSMNCRIERTDHCQGAPPET